MKLPENVVPMPAEQRAEIKYLASQATPGPWKVAPTGHVYTGDGRAPLHVVWLLKDNCRYIAALPPDVALATLAYVEAVEADNAKLTAQLAEARQELADQEAAALQWALELEEKQETISRERTTSWSRERIFKHQISELEDERHKLAVRLRELKEPAPLPLQGEAGAAKCQDCGGYLPATHQTDFCEGCHSKFFFGGEVKPIEQAKKPARKQVGQFVVKVPNGGSPFWLAPWAGDPGRTLIKENAKRFKTQEAATKAIEWAYTKSPWQHVLKKAVVEFAAPAPPLEGKAAAEGGPSHA